jgi:murein DD-endopeptidase MepM/ murein hydrolase activator NlpD
MGAVVITLSHGDPPTKYYEKMIVFLGYHIIINHNNGFYTVYGHMSGFNPEYSAGSTVSRGDVIGYIGSSGWATGPHLHFEVRTCIKWSCHTNPMPFLYK